MKIKGQHKHDSKNDFLLGFHLCETDIRLWSLQKLEATSGFYFDCKLVKTLIVKVTSLQNTGYSLAAIVSDLDSGNRGLQKECSINVDNPFFLNPVTGKSLCFWRSSTVYKILKKSLFRFVFYYY